MSGTFKRKRVAVVLGGASAEAEISQLTGESVARSLAERGYNVSVIRAGRDLPARLLAARIDVVFIALHGRFGEDGCVQGLLESMRIPYTGSGVLASAVGMDKAVCKRLWRHAGLPTPPWAEVGPGVAVASAFRLPAKLPVVVKPVSEGSSLGVSIVRERPKLVAAVEQARNVAPRILIERYIAGKEVTVGILGLRVLGTMEVVPKGEFLSYDVKYVPGHEEFLVPAPIPEATERSLSEIALAAHEAIRARGYSRTDFRIDRKNQPWLIEINTLPGLMNLSYLPKIAAHAGIPYGDLVERLLDSAALEKEEA